MRSPKLFPHQHLVIRNEQFPPENTVTMLAAQFPPEKTSIKQRSYPPEKTVRNASHSRGQHRPKLADRHAVVRRGGEARPPGQPIAERSNSVNVCA